MTSDKKLFYFLNKYFVKIREETLKTGIRII
ncbi:hypothetical protein METP3_00961 [Methanosarcinales archaeon]|nr:hypothetical protein METP3_00961 [Methanosarcinales archaeon]